MQIGAAVVVRVLATVGAVAVAVAVRRRDFRAWMHSTDNNMALVVDGPSLARIFDPDAPELTKMLMELVSICRAVIACRVTPGQKAEIVRQVRATVIPASASCRMFSMPHGAWSGIPWHAA